VFTALTCKLFVINEASKPQATSYDLYIQQGKKVSVKTCEVKIRHTKKKKKKKKKKSPC
jgi:hypothetical protein